MHPCSRLRKSRNQWKEKAVLRGTVARYLRKRLVRIENRLSDLENRVRDLETENAALRSSAAAQAPELPVAAGGKPSHHDLRTLCVLLVIHGIVSFRAVPRILAVFQHQHPGLAVRHPHFTSVINWTLRAGVAALQGVSCIREPWIAIIDCSIDIGTRKALVVLRVPLAAISRKQAAIGLGDCECIGVLVSNRWTGATVKDALAKVFDKAGEPRAILMDGGKDLRKGVRLYREQEDAKRIWVVEDVGHAVANALKSEFAASVAFSKFLDILRKGAARIRQTNLAALHPPKVRTKGRFQGITEVASWALKILELMGGKGRAAEDSELLRLRKAFSGLAQLRVFLNRFCKTSNVIERFLKVVKNCGINQSVYSEAKKVLGQLPDNSTTRRRMEVWLTRQLRVQSRLGIGQMALLASSDVIESLFGKFKEIVQRNPSAELNRLVYAMPLLCGQHTSEEISSALRSCSHRRLLATIANELPPTLRQLRRNLLYPRWKRVPNPGNPQREKAG